MSYLIAPSILAADFSKLGEEVEAVLEAGADIIHFDVMDGHYVPGLTVGTPVLEALCKRIPDLQVDVHLMVKHESQDLVKAFIDAGASYISIHPDSTTEPHELLNLIQSSHVQAGIVLNPDEPIDKATPYLELLDYLLIMSVFPGKGGQSFIPESTNRLEMARELLNETKPAVRLEVDGGIKLNNIRDVAMAGADMFVAGTAIFSTPDYGATIQEMRRLIAGS